MLIQSLRNHNGGLGVCYNDGRQRAALRWFVSKENPDPSFRKYLLSKIRADYTDMKFELIDDPLGNYAVDLGLVDKISGEIMMLIEVDYLTKFAPTWPGNYRVFHALERKFKYWEGKDIPYVACTFNTEGNKMIVSDDELQTQYMHTMKRKKMLIDGKWIEDKAIEIPLRESMKFGAWEQDELRRVS